MANSRTLVIDAYVGHCRSPADHACTQSPGPGDWRWYGIQLPVYLRHVDTPVATTAGRATPPPSVPGSPLVNACGHSAVSTGANSAADVASTSATPNRTGEHDSAPEATGNGVATGDLQRLVAEVPCGLHHSAVMPSLGQGLAVFCMHMSRVPVVLLCVVPADPAAPMEADNSHMHAAHASHPELSPVPQMHAAEEAPNAAVPQAQGFDDVTHDDAMHGMDYADVPGNANGDAGSAHAWGACIQAQEGEVAADCELTAAIAELIKFKRNKYVQKKSPQAWRIEPHLPRDIAGAPPRPPPVSAKFTGVE